jgi:hypothetical protein
MRNASRQRPFLNPEGLFYFQRRKGSNMTKEETAKIARENGSKSQSPTGDEGKAKSSRNGIKTREFAEKLAAFGCIVQRAASGLLQSD